MLPSTTAGAALRPRQPHGMTTLPYGQGKRQPSLSLNKQISVRGLYILPGGHRFWCSEVSGRPRKYEHKKCPESLLGRLSPPTERVALLV